MIKASTVMHMIKVTAISAITAPIMAVVLFGFALTTALKAHPIKKIMNATHTRIAGLISWLTVKAPQLVIN
ncbi:hypothetical protein ACQSED_09170 [Salmonella enterica]|uniref:hypothetical protein n=1 Tax=Salmonella enterica TaxID=28901 RepID=UPI003D31EA34